ncbi:MAG: histidine phosphatase family protein [Rhodothermales bacterium]
MKTLVFFRHAESDRHAASGLDHDRPISERGRRDAGRMGTFLASVGPLPDRILSSSAVRARSTLLIAMEEGAWGEIPVSVTDVLYEASVQDVLELVQGQSDALDRLLLAGHEPTWSNIIGRLVGQAHIRVSTGTMACIDLDIPSWKVTAFGHGSLRWLVPPKVRRAC